MKSSILLATNLAILSANAFPHLAMDHLTGPIAADLAYKRSLEKRLGQPPQGSGLGLLPLLPPLFSPTQLIDVTGEHAFTPPGPGDARGECPGLNALANHNYLPHNGVATISQFIEATTTVFGMGVDLATFLATYGAVLDGDGTSWSIGGGEHTGIAGSHGNYETDSSPLKSDLHQYGTNQKLVISQAEALLNLQSGPDANYNLDVLRTFRNQRFQQSISENPLFSYQPFAGMAVSQAAFTFIYRFMANHSAEYPEGVLTADVLKSFMALSGDNNALTWTPGYEQIPANWYRRNELDAYTIPYFESDVLYFTESNPQLSLAGCNEGAVNTYQTIDPAVLSGGAYTVSSAAASPLCFALEFAQAELPVLTGLGSSILSPLLSVLSSATATLACKPITNANSSALTLCPGFSLYGGPTGTVAPGAIQN